MYEPATREETLTNLKEKVGLGWSSVRIDSSWRLAERQRWALESAIIGVDEGWLEEGELHENYEDQYSYLTYKLIPAAILRG